MSAAERAPIKPAGANHNLWQIAKLGDVNQLEQALARGADVNAGNNLGLTPLMMAAYHGKNDMVKALVEYGADIHAVDTSGLTAAMLAESAHHAEIVRMLVPSGVKSSPAEPPSESSAVRSETSDSVNAIKNPEEVSTAKHPEVRTLHAPPEIWDLVHETRTEFKASSTFVEHFFRLHPLILTGILVVIGCGVGFFIALGTRTNTSSLAPQTDHNAAVLPLSADHSDAKSALNPKSPSSDQTPAAANQDSTNTPIPANPVKDTLDAFRNIDAGVAGESLGTQDVTRSDNEGNASHGSVEGEASGNGARLSSHRSSKRNPVLSNDKRAALAQSEDEIEATPTVPKQADKAPNPEPISPPKPDPTPKPKVIPWP